MSCNIYYITYMPRGISGRIVIEISPAIKRELYEALDKDGLTLKDWFLKDIQIYLEVRSQPPLFKNENPYLNKHQNSK